MSKSETCCQKSEAAGTAHSSHINDQHEAMNSLGDAIHKSVGVFLDRPITDTTPTDIFNAVRVALNSKCANAQVMSAQEESWSLLYPKIKDNVLARIAYALSKIRLIRLHSGLQHWYHTVFPYRIHYTCLEDIRLGCEYAVESYSATLKVPRKGVISCNVQVSPVVPVEALQLKINIGGGDGYSTVARRD